MTLPVLTAVTGETWEAGLVTALERGPAGLTVVRRCVDLADLLAAASTGTARAALLGAALRRLDRDAVRRLTAAGVAVVGLVSPGDEEATRRLRQLGVARVLAGAAAAEQITAAVAAAVAETQGATRTGNAVAGGPPPERSYGDPRAALRASTTRVEPPAREPVVDAAPPGRGRLVVVWGPTGAPGRTTVAVNLAAEAARLGVSTLLADADVYGGVVAQVLGLLDEAPGLAAAVRAANTASLDLAGLARLAPVVGPDLRVLTGIARPERWPELRPPALEVVYELARALVSLVVVDCGFALEQDEELAFDTTAPRRNGATLTTLDVADTVVAVGAADPVGVQRLVRALGELRETAPGVSTLVVLNKVRPGPVGADPKRQLAEALDRYAGVAEVVFVPHDLAALDSALLHGRALAEVAAGSPARLALAELAARLADVTSAPTGSRRRSRRRA